MHLIRLHDETPTRQEQQLTAPAIAPSYIESDDGEHTEFGIDPFDALVHKETITQTTTISYTPPSPGRITGTIHINRKTVMTTNPNTQPSRTFKLSTLAALNQLLPKMSAVNYDPLVHADDLFKSPILRASIASSQAWYIDVLVVNNVRTLFYELFDEAIKGASVESYNEFLTAMTSRSAREETLYEQGFETRAGVQALTQLLLLRQTYHDNASSICDGVPEIRHIVPSLERLITDQKPMPVTADRKIKMKLSAEFAAMDPETGAIDEKLAEEILVETLKRADMEASDRHEMATKRIPAMIGILQFIEQNTLEDTAEFHDLPLDIRKRFVESMLTMVDNAVKRAQTIRTVTSDEYMVILVEAKRGQRAIKEVLKQPSFSDSDDIETQAHIDHVRQEERLARKAEDKEPIER